MAVGKNRYYCRINGTIYNLEGIADYLNDESTNAFLLKLYEDYGIDMLDANDFWEYVRDGGYVIPPEWNTGMTYPGSESWKIQQRVREMTKNAVTCPTCGSKSTRKLGYWDKTWFNGKLNKTFECGNCGYTW